MTIKYANKYGSLEVEPLTDYRPVNTIFGKDVPDEFKFSFEQAEKIVLITENRRSQVASEGKPYTQWYLVVHESVSTAAAVRIVSLNFTSDVDPRKEIARVNRLDGYRLHPDGPTHIGKVLEEVLDDLDRERGLGP